MNILKERIFESVALKEKAEKAKAMKIMSDSKHHSSVVREQIFYKFDSGPRDISNKLSFV